MTTNTKQRHLAILTKAHEIIDEHNIDVAEAVHILPLAKMLAVAADCHITTAKNNIAKAVRQKRGKIAGLWDEEESGAEWGGLRYPAGGRPPKEVE